MKNQHIEQVAVSKLVPYPGNPMVHPDTQIKQLVEGIRRFGFRQPILVDGDFVVVTGHGRLQAAKAAGLETVPVIFTGDMTQDEIRAYRIADNKLARGSSFDMEAIATEIGELAAVDFDLELTGFTDEEINNLLEVDFLPDTPFQSTAQVQQSVQEAVATPDTRGTDKEQLRKEPEKNDGELKEIVRPSATSNDHSVFECVMLHSNKVQLVKVLDQIRAANNYEKIEQALMHLVRNHQ